MRRATSLAATAILTALLAGGAATAHAARIADPAAAWDGTTVTVEYGEYWTLSATATDVPADLGPWTASGSLSGVPSGYAPTFSAYEAGAQTVYGSIGPAAGARPLPAGTYSATLSFAGTGGSPIAPPGPATVTVAPAALTMTLAVNADPSNTANTIISAELVGAFRDNFFTTSFAEGPLTPAGTWNIRVTDEGGAVVHEVSADRTDTDDNLGFSSYWPGVAPGQYTVRGTFTPTGPSAQNFTITQPSEVAYTAAPAPGATSTAAPAPPAPPASSQDAGSTLPAWIPVAAGVLSAGLLALLILQIIRLRRLSADPGAARGSEA
jgi:hypothetical protein